MAAENNREEYLMPKLARVHPTWPQKSSDPYQGPMSSWHRQEGKLPTLNFSQSEYSLVSENYVIKSSTEREFSPPKFLRYILFKTYYTNNNSNQHISFTYCL